MKKNLKSALVIIVVLAGLGAVAYTKAIRKSGAEQAANVELPDTQGAVYIFMNSDDQDGDCARLYSLFDELSSQLPPEIRKIKVDSNAEDQSLTKQFGVLVLPTVIFVNAKGEVRNRIEGEGEKVEIKIKEAFLLATKESTAQ